MLKEGAAYGFGSGDRILHADPPQELIKGGLGM